jgi:antitoxin component YwqK of YwqJK toxin-antitoxin module
MFRFTEDENKLIHSFNDEPAAIHSNGTMIWYKHGKRHRDNDLPAAIYVGGTKEWYKNGMLHRETDAAVINYNGMKSYYLDGKQYEFDKWIKLTPISKEQKLQLILEK